MRAEVTGVVYRARAAVYYAQREDVGGFYTQCSSSQKSAASVRNENPAPGGGLLKQMSEVHPAITIYHALYVRI